MVDLCNYNPKIMVLKIRMVMWMIARRGIIHSMVKWMARGKEMVHG